VAFASRFWAVDLGRRAWEELPGLLEEVSRTDYAGGIVYVAVGTKAVDSRAAAADLASAEGGVAS